MINRLNREEILRYLGYKDSGITPRIEKLLDRCESETLKIIQPKYIYKRFPVTHELSGICVGETGFVLRGEDIREHLKNCNEIFLLGVTAGIELDRKIRRYMVTEPDIGVVLDSCGIQAVEQIADMAEQEIEACVSSEGYHLTWRFSPGYGDLPLDTQKELVQVLDMHHKIGVSLTDSCLMVPSKSVTAILGISDTKRDKRENKCDFCNNRQKCIFRKRGTRC